MIQQADHPKTNQHRRIEQRFDEGSVRTLYCNHRHHIHILRHCNSYHKTRSEGYNENRLHHLSTKMDILDCIALSRTKISEMLLESELNVMNVPIDYSLIRSREVEDFLYSLQDHIHMTQHYKQRHSIHHLNFLLSL